MDRGVGLPGAAAVALSLGLALAGALYDVLTGPGLRLVFAAAFVLGCVLAAFSVRKRDLLVAVVSPPLVYLAVAVVAGAVQGSDASGSWLVRIVMDVFTALVVEAPALLVGTGAAVLVALLRGLGSRARTRA